MQPIGSPELFPCHGSRVRLAPVAHRVQQRPERDLLLARVPDGKPAASLGEATAVSDDSYGNPSTFA